MPSGVYPRKPVSETHRKNLSQALTGRVRTSAERLAISEGKRASGKYTVTAKVKEAHRTNGIRVRNLPKVPCPNGCGGAYNSQYLKSHLPRCSRPCSVAGCLVTPHVGRGYCAGHYRISKCLDKHKLTLEQYYEMYRQQDGRCAICSKACPAMDAEAIGREAICVDHDHITGAVRGLICHPCNISLGLMRDDPARLRAAADYIDRSRV